jgi:hypothetical protein
MATTKKKAPVKKTTTKKAPTKPSPAKKTPVKKTSVKRTAAKKQPEMRSFRISNDKQPFTDFRITRQTVYWIILIAFIIFAQLWILKLQIEVATLIDAQQAQLQNL